MKKEFQDECETLSKLSVYGESGKGGAWRNSTETLHENLDKNVTEGNTQAEKI